MKRRLHGSALCLVVVVATPGCRHETDAPAPASETATATPTLTATATATPTPTATPDAPPSPPDMSAAPAYPASNLFDTFSSATARAKLIACYTPGKQRDPKLRGKVVVKFTINGNGMAKPVENSGSNLTDDDVIACVVRTIKTLHFPKPVEGSVTVVYPFIFRPTGDETLILPEAGKK